MSLRYIVPALGIIAFTNPAAQAADSALSIGGFVDTILAIDDNRSANDATTDKNEEDATVGFTADVEIRLGYKIGEKVGAKVDIEYHNVAIGTLGNSNVDLEQAFINYAFADKMSWTIGKFTTPIGFIAADADGLYRINAGPVVNLYGSDVVGTALNFTANDDLGISFFVVNGWGLENGFDAYDQSIGNDDSRGNLLLGIGLDLVYKIGDVGSINFEAVYDPQNAENGATGAADAASGDVFQVGLNGTFKPYEALTLGAEVIYRGVGEDDGAGDDDRKDYGVVAMANHTIPGFPCPASGTLMYQRVDNEADDTLDPAVNEVAVALLTNPTGDSKFGLNAEVSYEFYDGGSNRGGSGTSNVEDESWIIAFEALAVIP